MDQNQINKTKLFLVQNPPIRKYSQSQIKQLILQNQELLSKIHFQQKHRKGKNVINNQINQSLQKVESNFQILFRQMKITSLFDEQSLKSALKIFKKFQSEKQIRNYQQQMQNKQGNNNNNNNNQQSPVIQPQNYQQQFQPQSKVQSQSYQNGIKILNMNNQFQQNKNQGFHKKDEQNLQITDSDKNQDHKKFLNL